MVVPEAEEVEITLGLDAGRQSPQTGRLLEGLEEALDAAVLPRREGSLGGCGMRKREGLRGKGEER